MIRVKNEITGETVQCIGIFKDGTGYYFNQNTGHSAIGDNEPFFMGSLVEYDKENDITWRYIHLNKDWIDITYLY